MAKKGIVVLAGGTGFVGEYSRRAFEAAGREVRMVSRRPGHIAWTEPKALVSALEGADMLINLAGRLLEFGAILIRTEPELVLKSRWVLPQVLLEAGYEFEYPELEAALAAVRSGI